MLAVVPAAGRGARFDASAGGKTSGRKLLADVGGMPMLDRTISTLFAGGVDRVVVVLPPDRDLGHARTLNDPRVTTVVNPDPSRGMFSSIQIGLSAAEGDPILVLPGDMPFVRHQSVAAVLAAARASQGVVVAACGGKRGHPLGFRRETRELVLRAPATSNLSVVLTEAGIERTPIELDDPGVVRDVDVVSDLDSL
jgi:molybdenum cofactor cytidylyltransferase